MAEACVLLRRLHLLHPGVAESHYVLATALHRQVGAICFFVFVFY
eukprot:COSAG01_NODE_2143_length_8317_cov_24.964103_8_plen_45_part_00